MTERVIQTLAAADAETDSVSEEPSRWAAGRTYEACMPNIWAQANGSRESVWLPECAPGKATEGTYKVHGAFDPAVRVVLPNSDPRGT